MYVFGLSKTKMLLPQPAYEQSASLARILRDQVIYKNK